uniref:Uncharacterized protein n=1 Tax=Microcebus murinus TaxID=30608 RepID=A0A8C5YD69_MICMU
MATVDLEKLPGLVGIPLSFPGPLMSPPGWL